MQNYIDSDGFSVDSLVSDRNFAESCESFLSVWSQANPDELADSVIPMVYAEKSLKMWSRLQAIRKKVSKKTDKREGKTKDLSEEEKTSVLEDVIRDFHSWTHKMTQCGDSGYLCYLPNHEKGTILTINGIFPKCGKPPRKQGNSPLVAEYNQMLEDVADSARLAIQEATNRGFKTDYFVQTPYTNLMKPNQDKFDFITYKMPYPNTKDTRKEIPIDFLNKGLTEGTLIINGKGVPKRILKVKNKEVSIDKTLCQPYLDLVSEILMGDQKQIDIFHGFHASAFQFPLTLKAAKMALFLCGGHNIGKSTINNTLNKAISIEGSASWFMPVNAIATEYTNNGILMATLDDTWGKEGESGDFHKMIKALQSGLGDSIRENEKFIKSTSTLRSYAFKFNNNTLPSMTFIDDRTVFLDLVTKQGKATIDKFRALNKKVYDCLEDEGFLNSIVDFYLEYDIPKAIFSRGVSRDILGSHTKCATNAFLRSTLSNHNNNTKLSSKMLIDFLDGTTIESVNKMKNSDRRRHIYMEYYTPTRQKAHKKLATDSTKTMRVDIARLLAIRVDEKDQPFLIEKFYVENTVDNEHKVFIKFSDAIDLDKFRRARHSNKDNYLLLDLDLGATDPRIVDLVDHPRSIPFDEPTIEYNELGLVEYCKKIDSVEI